MQKHTLTIVEINDYVNLLRKKNGRDIFTNYFGQKQAETNFETITTDNCIAFIKREGDFSRLYFFSIDKSSCADVLKAFTETPIVIDYLTNKPIDDAKEIFTLAGFNEYAEMLRLKSSSVPALNAPGGRFETLTHFFETHPTDITVDFAVRSELSEIQNLLFTVLDKYVGHFPSEEELLELIDRKEVTFVRQEGKIVALHIFKINGKVANSDQIFNLFPNDQLMTASLLLLFYKLLNEKNVITVYAWTKRENKKMFNTHKSFGMKPDGLVDYVFLKN